MAVQYEWKERKGGGRRYVRSFVPDPPSAVKVLAPDPPVVEPVEVVTDEPTKPKRGRPRKVEVIDE